MFNKKKGLLILLLLIVSISAISCVSAVSDDADDMASEIDSGEESISEIDNDEVVGVDSDESASGALENEIDDGEKLTAGEDDSALTKDQNDEVLGYSALAEFYDVYLDEAYIITSNKKSTITGTVTPPAYNLLSYSFKLFVVDDNGDFVCNSPSFTGRGTSFTWTIPAKTILPGVYDIWAVNDQDSKVMAESVLGVDGTVTITGNDFKGYYMSGSKMTVKVIDKVTKKPINSLLINMAFTNTKTGKTETYDMVPDSNGYISLEPPVGVGTWSVKFYSDYDGVKGSLVKTAEVLKSQANIQAYKVTEYKGFKTTIKAKVTCNGRDVNEGTVTFKINGKTYNVPVKNGWATKTIKLTKIKTYKYTAQFNGNDNLYPSKKVNSKAVLKKRLKTKITTKNYALYVFKQKRVTIKVKTTTGKKVKDGKLKIVGAGMTQYVNVKNGKAKFTVKGLHALKHFIGFKNGGETYKKSITQKFKIKYIPTSHKYKASGKSMKVTSKFKCPLCGKTKTHPHYKQGVFYAYRANLMRIV